MKHSLRLQYSSGLYLLDAVAYMNEFDLIGCNYKWQWIGKPSLNFDLPYPCVWWSCRHCTSRCVALTTSFSRVTQFMPSLSGFKSTRFFQTEIICTFSSVPSLSHCKYFQPWQFTPSSTSATGFEKQNIYFPTYCLYVCNGSNVGIHVTSTCTKENCMVIWASPTSQTPVYTARVRVNPCRGVTSHRKTCSRTCIGLKHMYDTLHSIETVWMRRVQKNHIHARTDHYTCRTKAKLSKKNVCSKRVLYYRL